MQDDSSPRPQTQDDRPEKAEDDAFRSMVHQLIDVCHINQRHLTGLHEEVTFLHRFQCVGV